MRALFLLLALSLAAAGCDSSTLDNQIGDLTVSLFSADPAPQLIIETEEIYSMACALGTQVDADSDSIGIEILGTTADVCPAVVGPRGAYVRLPDTGLEGYEIELRKNGETDRYRIGRAAPDLPLRLEAVGRGSFSRTVPFEFPED